MRPSKNHRPENVEAFTPGPASAGPGRNCCLIPIFNIQKIQLTDRESSIPSGNAETFSGVFSAAAVFWGTFFLKKGSTVSKRSTARGGGFKTPGGAGGLKVGRYLPSSLGSRTTSRASGLKINQNLPSIPHFDDNVPKLLSDTLQPLNRTCLIRTDSWSESCE